MTISLTVNRKVNLGNYESAELYMSVKDVHPGATEEEVRAMVEETGGAVFSVVMESLGKQLKAIRVLNLLEKEHEPD